MLKTLAEIVTSNLYKREIIEKEKTAVYIYGIELFFSTMTNVLSILIISLIVNKVYLGIIFILYFMPIRLFCGGYHAKTFASCFIITNSLFIIIALVSLEPYFIDIKLMISIFLYFFSLFYIYFNAPILHGDQKIKPEKIIKNRKGAKTIIIIEIFIFIIMLITKVNQVLVLMTILTTFAVAIMMVISKKHSAGNDFSNKQNT